MKQIMILTVLFFFSVNAFAQTQEIIATFIVTDASMNGENITQEVVTKGGAYTVFYQSGRSNLLYMANVWPKQNSQSWGALYMEEIQNLPETSNQLETDIYFFRWEYQNSYDTKRGTCNIQFIKTYKPQGITSTLKMITEELDITIFKGHMEGTLDFSKFQ